MEDEKTKSARKYFGQAAGMLAISRPVAEYYYHAEAITPKTPGPDIAQMGGQMYGVIVPLVAGLVALRYAIPAWRSLWPSPAVSEPAEYAR